MNQEFGQDLPRVSVKSLIKEAKPVEFTTKIYLFQEIGLHNCGG